MCIADLKSLTIKICTPFFENICDLQLEWIKILPIGNVIFGGNISENSLVLVRLVNGAIRS